MGNRRSNATEDDTLSAWRVARVSVVDRSAFRVEAGLCALIRVFAVAIVVFALAAAARAADSNGRWDRILSDVETYVRSAIHSKDDYQAYSAQLAKVVSEARANPPPPRARSKPPTSTFRRWARRPPRATRQRFPKSPSSASN